MNSKEALEKLLKENEDARERLKKLVNLSEEEAKKELEKFQKEFGVELKKEDFANQELNNEQLEGVNGGADVLDMIGLALGVYDLINRPNATGRGTKNGTSRFN